MSGKAKLIHGDALSELKKLPKNHFQLIFTSPPYNIGKEYEKIILDWQDYSSYMSGVVKECRELLTSNGSIVFQLGNWVLKDRRVPLDIKFFPLFENEGFYFQNRIIWHYNWGYHCSKRFSGRYETCLWFTKNREYYFNVDPVRIPQKYPKKKSYKGINKGSYSCNKLGKNPTDFWIADSFKHELVETPNITRNNPEKMDHPCQSPLKLINNFVLCLTREKDNILDPFGGVGSVVLSALLNNRSGWMIEKEKKYLDQAYLRIKKENDLCPVA